MTPTPFTADRLATGAVDRRRRCTVPPLPASRQALAMRQQRSVTIPETRSPRSAPTDLGRVKRALADTKCWKVILLIRRLNQARDRVAR